MIKVVALDIYGTVLATNDPDNEMPPRKGLEGFFDKCKLRGIQIVSASDAIIENVKIDLEETFRRYGFLHLLQRFEKFYHLNQLSHKDFSLVLQDCKIEPRRLLVIGDSDKDILGARDSRAHWFRVPEYFGLDDYEKFDLSKIKF